MTSNIEIIRAAEAKIPPMEEELRDLREEAMEDDIVTPEEQAEIDAVDNKLTELRNLVTTKRAEWEANRDRYNEIREQIDSAFSPVSECEYEFLNPEYDRVNEAETQVAAPVNAEDYATAITEATKLHEAVNALVAAKDMLEQRRETYETNLATIQPKLDEYSVSRPDRAFLDTLIGELASLQTETEEAATFGDFDKASLGLDNLSAKVDDIEAAIEAKKEEYEGLRSDFDAQVQEISGHNYVDLGAERDAFSATTTAIDALADAEDWQGAIDLTNQGLTDCESYGALVDEQENLIAQIETRLPTMRTDLAAHSSSTSSVKRGADANVATIEAALTGGGSLTDAFALTDTVMQQVTELNHLKAAMDRLDAADPDDLDDVSRTIVDEMVAAGTLDQLPTELRTTLVDNLMEGTPTQDEHDAIQEIFSLPHVDRQFDAVDSEVRQSIVDAYMNDPEVQELAENWATIPPDERMAAVEKLIQVPCGEDGWDVGLPGNINAFDTPEAANGDLLYGAYNHSTDTMTFNVNDDAHADFGEVLDTITHEMGHRYQMQLIERLDPSHPDALSPGDAEYEQARWLQQDDDYFNRFNDDSNDDDPFDRIYFTSPSETHSRVMGNEVKEGLAEGFDLPEDEDDEDGHDHGHHH